MYIYKSIKCCHEKMTNLQLYLVEEVRKGMDWRTNLPEAAGHQQPHARQNNLPCKALGCLLENLFTSWFLFGSCEFLSTT